MSRPPDDDEATRRLPVDPPHRPAWDATQRIPVRSGDRPQGRDILRGLATGAPASARRPPPPRTGRGDPPTQVMPVSPRTGTQTRGAAPASRATASPPAPRRPAVRRRRGRGRWVVLLVLLALLAYPVALGVVAWSGVDRVEALGDSSFQDTPGTTHLVVGSDSREGLTPEEVAALSTGVAGGNRTDTILLLHTPSGGGPTALVSLPRDSFVQIPGRGENKINAAYSLGGPSLLVDTVEQATGLRVDRYVETGFGGFAAVVDAVGGVELCPAVPIVDPRAGLDIPAGCQAADGPTALGYARTRYEDPLGDLGRVARQREVLAAIMDRTVSPGVLLNPLRAFPAARAGGRALTLDDGASPFALLGFVNGMRTAAGGGASLTVPISDANASTSAGSSVLWDDARAAALFNALRADDTEAVRVIAEEQRALLGG